MCTRFPDHRAHNNYKTQHRYSRVLEIINAQPCFQHSSQVEPILNILIMKLGTSVVEY